MAVAEGKAGVGGVPLVPSDAQLASCWGVIKLAKAGDTVVSVAADHRLLAWQPARAQLVSTRESIHTNKVTSLSASPDGHLLATACEDGLVKLWSVSDEGQIAPNPTATLTAQAGSQSSVSALSFLSNTELLCGRSDGLLQLRQQDANGSWVLKDSSPSPPNLGKLVDMQREGDCIVTAYENNADLRLWRNMQPTGEVLAGPNSAVCAINVCNGCALVGYRNGELGLWHLTPDQPAVRLAPRKWKTAAQDHTEHQQVTAVQVLPNGWLAASVGDTIDLWWYPRGDAGELERGPSLQGHTMRVTTMMYHGGTLFAGDASGVTIPWRVGEHLQDSAWATNDRFAYRPDVRAYVTGWTALSFQPGLSAEQAQQLENLAQHPAGAELWQKFTEASGDSESLVQLEISGLIEGAGLVDEVEELKTAMMKTHRSVTPTSNRPPPTATIHRTQHVRLIGHTHVGKTTVSAKIAKGPPPPFAPTMEITYVTGQWRSRSRRGEVQIWPYELCDTPGLGVLDAPREEQMLRTVASTSTFQVVLLVISAANPVVDATICNELSLYYQVFGQALRAHLAVLVTRASAIEEKNKVQVKKEVEETWRRTLSEKIGSINPPFFWVECVNDDAHFASEIDDLFTWSATVPLMDPIFFFNMDLATRRDRHLREMLGAYLRKLLTVSGCRLERGCQSDHILLELNRHHRVALWRPTKVNVQVRISGVWLELHTALAANMILEETMVSIAEVMARLNQMAGRHRVQLLEVRESQAHDLRAYNLEVLLHIAKPAALAQFPARNQGRPACVLL